MLPFFRRHRKPDPAIYIERSAAEDNLRASMAEFQAQYETRMAEAIETTRRDTASEIARMIASSPMMNGLDPLTGPKRDIYKFDNPWRFLNITTPKKRPDATVDLATCVRIADTYDPLRIVIQHLKREVENVPINIQPKNPRRRSADENERRIEQAWKFFEDEGGLGGYGFNRRRFENEIFENMLVCGAYVAFMEHGLGGKLLQCFPVEMSTIKPVVDIYGWEPDGPRYEQWVMGLKVADKLEARDIVYDGLIPRPDTPYYVSPIEYLLGPFSGGLSADMANQTWLRDGDSPWHVMALPEDWTPDQIQQFAEWWNALMAGNVQKRVSMRFVPAGSKAINLDRKDNSTLDLEVWFARRVAAIYGVSLSVVNLESIRTNDQQTEMQQNVSHLGVRPLLNSRIILYNRILRELGFDDLEAVDATKAAESDAARAQRLMVATGGAWLTVNEARAEEGYAPIPGQENNVVRDALTGDANVSGNNAAKGKKNGSDAKPDGIDKQMRAEIASDTRKWFLKSLSRLASSGSGDCEFHSQWIPPSWHAEVGGLLTLSRSETDVICAFAPLWQWLGQES